MEAASSNLPQKAAAFLVKDLTVVVRLFLQAPVPAGAWQGELNTTEDGSECPQGFFPTSLKMRIVCF